MLASQQQIKWNIILTLERYFSHWAICLFCRNARLKICGIYDFYCPMFTVVVSYILCNIISTVGKHCLQNKVKVKRFRESSGHNFLFSCIYYTRTDCGQKYAFFRCWFTSIALEIWFLYLNTHLARCFWPDLRILLNGGFWVNYI